MGEAASHKSGINDWAKIDTKNSERDNMGPALRFLSLKSMLGENLPWINPTAWLRYIINHGLLYMLSGLHFEERHLVGRTWQEFWTKYQGLNPTFDLFNSGHFDPTTTIGLFVHGDEGRTLKRNGLMVTTLQSILGQGFDRKRLKRPRDDMKLHVNFKGHTFILHEM